MSSYDVRPKGKKLSRPPLLPATIDGHEVELYNTGGAIDVTVGWKPLLTLEDWQYHILNGLNGRNGNSLDGLQEMVKDRFGLAPPHAEINRLFQTLKAHELVAPEEQARLEVVARAISGSGNNPVDEAKAKPVAALQNDKPGLVLFRPNPLLWSLSGIFWIGPWLSFLLPPLLVVAIFEAASQWNVIVATFNSYQTGTNLLSFLFLGLVSVNLLVTVTHACAAHAQGASVSAVVLQFLFGFLPRLGLHLEDTAKLSRRQAMLVHATPLITRLYIASVGIMVFLKMQHFAGPIPQTALIVSAIAALSFLLTACPLIKGSGYYLLVEYLDEPKLRAKAFKALWNVFNRSRYQKADPQILVAYALASIAFTLLVAALAFLVFGKRLVAEIGPDGIILIALLIGAFLVRTWLQLRKTNEIYWKNFRFERWRDRTLPSQEQRKIERKTRITPWTAIKFMALVGIVIGLLQPYEYRPSGPVVMLPQTVNQLTTDTAGIVEEVNFRGGEFVVKGTPVAKLSTADLEAQVRIGEAELARAKMDLDFAKVTCERNRELFTTGTVSDAQLQRSLSDCAAAQASVDILVAEIERLQFRIERSTFRMPFDGQLGSLYLQERLGMYLEEGEPIATVRDASSFKVQLSLREVDLSLAHEGTPIEVRVYAYPDKVFHGEIVSIDPDVQATERGRIAGILASIDNSDGVLSFGMSGVAKVDGVEMPVWQIITQGIYRFLVIDLWGWLP